MGAASWNEVSHLAFQFLRMASYLLNIEHSSSCVTHTSLTLLCSQQKHYFIYYLLLRFHLPAGEAVLALDLSPALGQALSPRQPAPSLLSLTLPPVPVNSPLLLIFLFLQFFLQLSLTSLSCIQ